MKIAGKTCSILEGGVWGMGIGGKEKGGRAKCSVWRREKYKGIEPLLVNCLVVTKTEGYRDE
jgi:hypothetical protein